MNSLALALLLILLSIPNRLVGQTPVAQQTIWFKMESHTILPANIVPGFSEISAIDYDPDSRKWLLATDTTGTLFIFSGVISPTTAATLATGIEGLESIRFDRQTKRIYFAQEKGTKTSAGWFPYDIATNTAGPKTLFTEVTIPNYYNNRGYEGLTLAGGKVWICLESGEFIKGDTSGGKKPMFTNLQSWSLSDTSKVLIPFNRTSCTTSFGKTLGNGISEILRLDVDRFLILERCFNGTKANVKLFEASVQRGNVLKHEVFCFNDQGNFVAGNIEGMTWGEPMPDGRRTLVLISDSGGAELNTQLILLTEARFDKR